MNAASDPGLRAYRDAQFDWAVRLQDIWTTAVGDIPEMHADARRLLIEEGEQLKSQTSGGNPLGWFLTGSSGTGKTHTLNAVQDDLITKGFGFVLVDMSDVRDFWDTVAQGYIDSLQNILTDGRRQYTILIERFIGYLGPTNAANNVRALAIKKSAKLRDDLQLVLTALMRRHPTETLRYRDTVRALICLNSNDFETASVGIGWLQGLEADDAAYRELGFVGRRQSAKEVVRSLSWCMSLAGPTLLAFDQLDPIVHQVARQTTEENAQEQNTARWIIDQIGNGLGALFDLTTRTLVVVSCVEETYAILLREALSANLGRFHKPIRMVKPTSSELKAMVRGRLAPAYEKHAFTPPYPTWPFKSDAFEGIEGDTPRRILALCDEHRRKCIRGGVGELASFASVPLPPPDVPAHNDLTRLDKQFSEMKSKANVDELLDESKEDDLLASIYQAGIKGLASQVESLPTGVSIQIDREFGGARTNKPLHARLRITMHDEHDREEHYCLRVIQKANAAAFKTRLKGAIILAGIDRTLTFRRLVVVRKEKFPGGKETEKLMKEFQDKGGVFHKPTGDELRTLFALCEMQAENDPKLDDWMKVRKPLDGLNLAGVLVKGSLLDPAGAAVKGKALSKLEPTLPPVSPPSPTASPPVVVPHATIGPSADKVIPPASAMLTMVIGQKILGPDKLGDPVGPSLGALAKHTVVLAGAGSGKTVLLYRLVEEAALQGIPSIVVDCAGDLSCFDEPRTESPFWRGGDAELVQRFRASTEMVLWTPGKQSGNPLSLQPLPDFTAVKSDADELEGALLMANSSLDSIVAAGSSEKAKKKKAVLNSSLKFFARNYDRGSLNDYVEMLRDLPDGAGPGVSKERELAMEMADALLVQMTTNPLLSMTGAVLDPAVLFGDDRQRAKTRISVISLAALGDLNRQQTFLNQLAMILFSWIKKNPTSVGRPLRGLLVIDEAKDFVPSRGSSECKGSLLRLGAQARKYGLGLVFATQNPKEIENTLIGNCATHFYGLNNSPASLATLQDLMKQKGGDGGDIARLKVGQFYFHSGGGTQGAPIKVKVPDSLSNKRLLQEDEILAKAKQSRQAIERG